jgi:sphingomyelin phosphodiesterase
LPFVKEAATPLLTSNRTQPHSQLQIAYSDYSTKHTLRKPENAIEVSYICPSMTPTSGPPAFRVYIVDPVTFGVLDIETYIVNTSNLNYKSGPVWLKYCCAKRTYGPLVSSPLIDPHSTHPAFWHNVAAAFVTE